MGIGVVESSRHLCGQASTISDVIRPKDSTKIKDLTLIVEQCLIKQTKLSVRSACCY
jgi:hypothetical protein